jgi:hypothetical protein
MSEETIASLVFDHVVPRGSPACSPGPENVVVSCQSCNIIKGEAPVEDVFPSALPEIARRTSIYIGRRGGPRASELRRLGRELGDRLYPWAAEYRRTEAIKSLERYHRKRARAKADGIGGATHFPFGTNHEARP